MINYNRLLKIADIKIPLIGFYDVTDASPFAPFAEPGFCIFANYKNWLKGESTVISEENAGSFGCFGSGYWLCGIKSMPQNNVAQYLGGEEGLKSSPEVMLRWLENNPPYSKQFSKIVISRLKDEQYEYLKTITFFVNPDQLALLITGAEYLNSSFDDYNVIAPYGSGCAQISSMLHDHNIPQAIIGATDIAMRQHLPENILAFTVTKPMFEMLCQLDEKSFLHKSFWKTLQEERSLK